MSKKIGIITFHASHNCGSMLQAYALKEVLEKKYLENVEIIPFSNSAQRKMYGYIDFRLKKSAVKNILSKIFHLKTVYLSRKEFIDFSKKYLKVSKNNYRYNWQLKKISNKYDLIIAGGDQIWNTKCDDFDISYFLNFTTVKKVAYAPSFGGNNINNLKNKKIYINLLKKFDKISVREENGKRWIKDMLGLNVPIIVDPTMLLSKKEWIQKLNPQKIEEKYIFFYAFSYENKNNIKKVIDISNKLNMSIYMIDAIQYKKYKLYKTKIKLYKSGPISFITMISNASLVITQSFHGIVFSVLFEKQFWAIRNTVLRNPSDDRAVSLLKQLSFVDRYINIDSLNDIYLESKIDYSNRKKNIEKLINESYDYIETNIIEKK